RIDRWISPAGRDTFQVDTAAAAIRRGGWFGRGPGEGRIKDIIPDAHTDFIMAVTAEEFGMLVCLGIILLIAFISLKAVLKLTELTDRFCLLAAGGIIAQFTFQAFVNIASTIGMIPSKGMTLPFISYGGSSLLSMSIGFGFLLSLTRVNKQRS
ncbi:MAG: FtsW/RodA/SpoVE family cell cycle protein, partial [Alphaproteobacteria bacterium]|nr:FtsW/RodA/SpoVE family cell cycle protein [Alphaproteobacteria bacterium]